MPEKLAVIAGVGPGLGLALAQRLAVEGYSIAMIARRAEALRGYAEAIDGAAFGHVGDLADPRDVVRVMAEIRDAHGPVELLIYNASVWNPTPAMVIDPATFVRDVGVCATGALVTAQAVYPDMVAAGRGTMLFTGNGAAINPKSASGAPSLAAGKSALRGLVIAMAGALRSDGIRVAMLTLVGTIVRGGRLDPDRIAERFAALAALPREDDTVEVVYDGRDP